jgi:hypothetical protein
MASSSGRIVVALAVWLVGSVFAPRAMSSNRTLGVQFDAILELNAPLCRTHVGLFARYWVSPQFYRAAVVWAEPHEGSLNFPIYPPTLSVASDPNTLTINHQFQHIYDGVFRKPFEPRGPFQHRFNAYALADIRFAEQEALAQRIYISDLKGFVNEGEMHEQIVDIPSGGGDARVARGVAQIRARRSQGRLDDLYLLDPNGRLLKSINYEYGDADNDSPLLRERVFLAEHPIMVGFNRGGPTITISGATRQYSRLETMLHEGGRQCIVDFGMQRIGRRSLSLPVRIVVYSGDQRQVLRSVRLYNFVACGPTADRVEAEARRYAGFDANDMGCREMLLKHWMKPPQGIPATDVNTLRHLRTCFANAHRTDGTAGQELKRINGLLQVDWMLADVNRLEEDFREYLSLLAASQLQRMILFGGRNIVETTLRWRQSEVAERLLCLWLDAAVSQNDINSILDFADADFARGHFWTTAALTDRMRRDPRLAPSERFVAQAIRCLALARICQTKERPDPGATDLATAQRRWAMAHLGAQTRRAQIREDADAARQIFVTIERPTQEQRAWKKQLDVLEQNLLADRSGSDDPVRPEYDDQWPEDN